MFIVHVKYIHLVDLSQVMTKIDRNLIKKINIIYDIRQKCKLLSMVHGHKRGEGSLASI